MCELECKGLTGVFTRAAGMHGRYTGCLHTSTAVMLPMCYRHTLATLPYTSYARVAGKLHKRPCQDMGIIGYAILHAAKQSSIGVWGCEGGQGPLHTQKLRLKATKI